MSKAQKRTQALETQQNLAPSRAGAHALSLSIKLKQEESRGGLSASPSEKEQSAGESAKALRRAAIAVEAGSITFRQFDVMSRLLFWEGSHEALAKSLGVSVSTLRRDIRELDQAGFVARVYSPQLQRVVPLVRMLEETERPALPPSEPPPTAEAAPAKEPEPLPPSYEHTADLPEDWQAALDERAPGWQETKLTQTAKQRLERLCEQNKPNDLTDRAWERISKANCPSVYLSCLADAKGQLKPESKRAEQKPRRCARTGRLIPTQALAQNTVAEPMPTQPQPEPALDPAPITDKHRALFSNFAAQLGAS